MIMFRDTRHIKIKGWEEIAALIAVEKAGGRKTGFTNGCFDILHVGHVRYLTMARKSCDLLVIGLNSDGSVRRLKGDERPVNGHAERAEVLAALECVDYVTVFEQDTPRELIRSITPDMIFKGGDWKKEDVVGADHVEEHGGEVRIIPFVEGFSTTNTIRKLKGK
jgi:D-beta-D-heptose 7-phosphate kinase/D-beta-D-heptose 1-phosphate adenosyltransferase